MIYTVTFNPSLDYIVKVDGIRFGETNRAAGEQMFPGGKGINVSIVLNNLGVENTALGFIAGFTGDEIERSVRALGCKTDFIRLADGFSRINLKLKSEQETEINGSGPRIDADSAAGLLAKLDRLQSGDVLVLAGSIPKSMPDSIYLHIMERLQTRGVPVVVDATRDLLVNVLEKQPFLIKPNRAELEEIFGVKLASNLEVFEYARKLRQRGARNVLISRAGDGALFVGEDGTELFSPAPKGTVVNSVGAGDSMVAGFLAGYLQTGDYCHAFRMGISAGSASAFSEGLATQSEVEAIFSTL